MQSPPSSVQASVSCRLAEYLRIVSEFEPRSATHRQMIAKTESSSWGRILSSTNWLRRAVVIIVGTPVSFYKRSAVGACVFRIDGEQIERESRGRRVVKPWSSVAWVHRLSQGYLIELEKGAMPLPYRCFSREQRKAFEALVPGRKLGSPKQVA